MTNIAANPISTTDAVDPLPIGRIAMWLTIAGDLMFFLGLFGAFVVLRTGNAELFANHARALDMKLAGIGAILLIVSSGSIALAARAARHRSTGKCCFALLATLLCAFAFLGSRGLEYATVLNHHTVVGRQNSADPLMVFDGPANRANGDPILIINGFAAPVPAGFDVHAISETDIARLSNQSVGNAKEFTPAEIFEDIRYGPGKNIFFAIWYTLTSVHLIHLGIAMIAVGILIVQTLRKKAMPRHVEYAGLFWHFIVLIGLLLFPLFYLL